ncbi:unnamed protein product [Chondrus crispus]|uniref:Uncharacterized protein n=1 Tax=Chondrus crispus TaxID=2769 RepID=R7QGD3_CHOCR|nr:unnamed protein product [Chondrus crispus]CDF36838.1 unnamed protein product [Chondrus crispus]|eukprot:XP_005716657.1 unnamed protein product [Chondrus crispus]
MGGEALQRFCGGLRGCGDSFIDICATGSGTGFTNSLEVDGAEERLWKPLSRQRERKDTRR